MTKILKFDDFINETYLPIRGKVVTDGELIRAIRQASKDIKLDVTRVYSDDISPDEPIILDSSALKGMRWAVLSVEINNDKIGVRVMPYDHHNRLENKHYVEETEDVLPLAAFTDESVNKLYDLIEKYNNR